MKFSIVFTLLVFPSLLLAEDADVDKVLRFEQTPFKGQTLHCENEGRIEPKESDFTLLDYSIMSSNEGERFALVTLKNESSGHRIFNRKHVVAVFGDCSRAYPVSAMGKLAGGETLTLRVYIGSSRFPILQLLMSINTAA